MKNNYQAYRLFHFMLLVFIGFHMAISSPGWTQTGNNFLNPSNHFFLSANILVLVFLVLSLFHPNKIIYLVLTISFLISVKLDALPMIPNHIVFALIVFFTLLFGLLLYWDKNLEIRDRLGTWYEKISPYIRVELLLLYFFVVLHKLNYDYFNPDVSCGSYLYQEIAAVFPFFPTSDGINTFSLWSALGFEILILLFLFFRRTRVLGVLLGLFFHLLLSFHPELYILSFSAELYALYVLFLPADLIGTIYSKASDLLQTQQFRKSILYVGLVLILALIIYVFVSIPAAGIRESFAGILDFVHVIWLLWAATLIVGYAIIARPWFFKHADANVFQLKWSPLLIFLLLVLLNGFTPYLGLKTSTNFAMFSNLRVDGTENNHWFMTSKYQLADYQKDTVTILEASHPYLHDFIEWDEHIPFFELRKFLSGHSGEQLRVTYRRNGEIHTIELPADADHEAVTAPAWLANKLLIFRGVPKEGPTPCQW